MIFQKPANLPTSLLVMLILLAGCSNESPVATEATDSSAETAGALRFLDPPAGPGAMAANLAPSGGGILLTWLEPSGNSQGTDPSESSGHTFYQAELQREEWTAPRQIATGDAFFANWADLPAVAEAPDGTRFAHWLKKLGGDTYAYGATLATSKDGGETWQELGLLHDDASPTEHGFVSYAPLPEGGVQAFWLDGRLMPEGGGMQLRTVLLDGAAPKVSTLLDDRVCECCATDAALAADGPVVIYRDRSSSEVRDITIVRATSEGWSEPAVIHDDQWTIHGCPVNGPAVAADGDRVVVAWFTDGAPRTRVSTAFSRDGGASFSEPFIVDDEKPIGRVDVILDREGRGIISWMGSSNEGAEIRWRRVAADGDSSPIHIAAATSALRSSGVPRMIRREDEILISWLEGSEPSRLRAGLIAID